MKFPRWLKTLYWAALTALLTWVLLQRYQHVQVGSSQPIDIFLFLVWFALILCPLFAEINFFGLSLKKDIEELKRSVQNSFQNLTAELKNNNEFRPSYSPNIYVNRDAADYPNLEKKVESILGKYGFKEQSEKTPDPSTVVPNATMEMFAIRYQIEKEIRRIYTEMNFDDNRSKMPLFLLLQRLVKEGILPSDLFVATREVYSATSAAVHGEDVSESQLNFVRDTGPKLVSALTNMKY